MNNKPVLDMMKNIVLKNVGHHNICFYLAGIVYTIIIWSQLSDQVKPTETMNDRNRACLSGYSSFSCTLSAS